MATWLNWLVLLSPWVMVAIVCFGFYRLVMKAKAGRATAFVIGAFLQMMLPDPYAERTIEIVQDRKKEVIKQQGENGAPPEDEEASASRRD